MKSWSTFFLVITIGSLAAVGLLDARSSALRQPTPDGATIEVPFRMLPSNHMVVEAKLNGKGPFRFVFDLGAPVTLLTNKAAEESETVDKKAPKAFLMGTRGEAQIKQVQIGDLVADKVPVIVMDHPVLSALSGMLQKPLAGIIGYTFWARYRMTIDYQTRKMTFTPIDFEVQDLFKELPGRLSGPKRQQTIVLAPRGIWGFTLGEGEGNDGAPIIGKVVEESPAAEAGLRAGDAVAAIDGRWITKLTDAYAAAAKVAPGTTVSIEVVRGDERKTLKITPREGL
jgi:membrane-associated protease RseP (regulator of RpoE activity)